MAGRRRYQRIGTYGICIDDEDRVLLVRASKQSNAPGSWFLPGGGLEHGEAPLDGLRREVAEETGLVVTCGHLIGAVERPGPSGSVYEIRDYAALITGGELAAGDDAAGARWVTPAQAAAMDIAGQLTTGLMSALRSWGVL